MRWPCGSSRTGTTVGGQRDPLPPLLALPMNPIAPCQHKNRQAIVPSENYDVTWCSDCGALQSNGKWALPSNSPCSGVPVAALEALETEMREGLATEIPIDSYQHGLSVAKRIFADRLHSLITGASRGEGNE